MRDQTARLGCATLRTNTRLAHGACFLLYEARTYRGHEEGKSTQTYVDDCRGAEGDEDKLVGVCYVLRRLVDLEGSFCCTFNSMSSSKPLGWLSDREMAGVTNMW